MSNKQSFVFSRKINLGPAIGDWTTIQFRESDEEDFNVSSVRDINFDSLAKSTLKEAHYLHYRLAENLIRSISVDLNTKLELHSVHASQVVYSDFLDSNVDDVVQMEIEMPELGSIFVVFDWDLVDQFIDRLTGGPGSVKNKSSFSKLELNVLNSQMKKMIYDFLMPWHELSTATPYYSIHQGKIIPDRRCSSRDAYILFTFNFYFGKSPLRKIVMAYSNQVLRRLMLMKQDFTAPIPYKDFLSSETLNSVFVPAKVELGTTKVKMKELSELKVGDVVSLQTNLSDPLKLFLGEQVSLMVQPGTSNGKLCVQLVFPGGIPEKPVPITQKVVDFDSYSPVLKEPILTSGRDIIGITHTSESHSNDTGIDESSDIQPFESDGIKSQSNSVVHADLQEENILLDDDYSFSSDESSVDNLVENELVDSTSHDLEE
tara:strand:+ start:2731 stop:4023 length:1293 start_codon:yes stop_codon:yes gene_type:complete